MTIGKDPAASDGLGGVHKVRQARPAVPAYQPDAQDDARVAHGTRAGESRLEADADQVARVVHTEPPPIDPTAEDHRHTPESEEGGARSLKAPLQDAQATPPTASAWEARR
jgi:hypothetical protein